MTEQSRATGSIFVLELGPPPQKVLVLQLEIRCPTCGQQRIQILGHHLRALRETIRLAFDTYPELLGADADLQVGETMTFTGRTGNPSTN